VAGLAPLPTLAFLVSTKLQCGHLHRFRFLGEMREGADLCAVADRTLREDAVLPHEHIAAQRAVLDDGVGPDETFGAMLVLPSNWTNGSMTVSGAT